MSQPTVSRIVDELLSRGILMEGEATQPATTSGDGGANGLTSVGRPSTPLELDRRRPRFVAIQLGVRKTRLAVLPIAIPDADRWDHEFDTPSNSDRWGRQLSDLWSSIATKGVSAVVVSLPGVVDEHTGRVFLSPNLRWTEQAHLADILKTIFGKPILFVQEIRALALGQLTLEPEVSDFLLVDAGSGVGAAAVAGGRLYTGPLPLSGELGHTPVLGNTRRCGCGAVGCIETLISRKGLIASAQEELGQTISWPQLLNLLATGPTPAWLKRSLDAAAIIIASALNVLGLRQVVLTGGLAELPVSAVEYISEAIRADAMWARFGSVICRTAPRRRLAGMVSLAIDRTLLVPRVH